MRTFTWITTNKRISKMCWVINFSSCSAIIIPSTNFVVFSSSSFLRALIFEQIDWVEILFSKNLSPRIFFPFNNDTTQSSVPDSEILSVRSVFENQINPNWVTHTFSHTHAHTHKHTHTHTHTPGGTSAASAAAAVTKDGARVN